ncbi:hypothetical protein DFJ73DRAFT_630896, partial [Zopfochytrium polystomum]
MLDRDKASLVNLGISELQQTRRATHTPLGAEAAAAELERARVHAVYDAIASHFSATRYKPWPVVDNFLRSLPNGSLGADIGCGNSKYMCVNRDVMVLGSD